MRLPTFALLPLLSCTVNALAELNNLKPSDFEPLTELPWKKANATTESVLDAIFREPNINIRYPVLAEYLRRIPITELGKAFDRCIDLEGTQTPDDLVEFFLELWAQRDPKHCWERTQQLFRIVGIEHDWLTYDGWGTATQPGRELARPRITVQDRKAISASRFWLRSSSLMSFPIGVEKSSLPKKDRVQIMKEFADTWLRRFGSWPGYRRAKTPWNYVSGYSDSGSQFIHQFEYRADASLSTHGGLQFEQEAAFEIAARRWMEANPASAPETMKATQEQKWPPIEGRTDPRPAGPSTELFIIWAKVDLPGMIKWAESLDLRKDELALRAKGFLMSRVDAETRNRWLAEAKSETEEEDYTANLLAGWAAWDPKPALDAAVATKDAQLIHDAAERAAFGPWGLPLNTSHYGLGVIKAFDAVASLPEETRKEAIAFWEPIMSQMGDVDIGEAARYGVDLLLRIDYVPRDGLLKFLTGHDVYPDEGGILDRTFCALRVWAVVRPKEMKAWIGTIKDVDMCKALTWLLEHPWGTGPEE